MTNPRDEGLRDAAAWLLATNNKDQAGRDAIAMNCDPVELVDAMTDIVFWLIKDQKLDFAHSLQMIRDSVGRYDD